MIARAADFYEPETPNGLPDVLVFEPFVKNQKASWLANDSVPHSYTYTPDAAQSLVTLAESESAWNQTWHVATTPKPPTGKEFIAMAARDPVPRQLRRQALARRRSEISRSERADGSSHWLVQSVGR
jgi:nucleoside-diphosphate-sugar epimerase